MQRRGLATLSVKEVVTRFSPNDFNAIDPDDLHIAPAQFIEKPVEIPNMRCIYAMDGVRCIALPPAMITIVFAKAIVPAAQRKALKNDCNVIRSMAQSPACRRNIRMVPTGYSETSLNAFAKRVVVTAGTIEVLPTWRRKH
ncbi:hypothetical protein [Bradyrhizobium ivorense]|uniref:hypothetical protein n=1 Tax=Bradyrhizobium ivorense TaxID=2511166 RepID=UPI00111F96C5|nr:hypothetical protein [Bradyrhizobium ivorense]